MPLPSMAQAESLNLVRYCRHDLCAGCGKEPKAPGRLLGHQCRASLGLTDQGRLGFDIPPRSPKHCDICGEEIPHVPHSNAVRHQGVCTDVYQRQWRERNREHVLAYGDRYRAEKREAKMTQEAMNL